MKEETERQAKIMKVFRKVGCVVQRLHSGRVRVQGGWMVHNEAGTPDLIVAGPGGSVAWAETKTDDGELSAPQKRVHAKLRRLGHEVYVVRDEAQALSVAKLLGCGRRA